MMSLGTRAEPLRSLVPRMAVAIAAGLLLHLALLARLRVLDVRPDVALLLAITGGIEGGAEIGAVVGLLSGFGMDLFLDTPFGLSAAVLTVVGYVVGGVRSGSFPGTSLVPMLLLIIASAVGNGVWRAAAWLTGLPLGGVRNAVIGVAVVTGWNVVLTPVVRPILRWGLPDGIFGGRHE